MPSSKEALSQRDIIGAMFAVGWEYVSWLELPHYCLIKREEERLLLEEAEIIDRLNDLYGAEVSDDDKLHFTNGIADSIERDETVMAQVRNHSED